MPWGKLGHGKHRLDTVAGPNIGDVVLGIRIDDAALFAGLEAARRRVEGAAPVAVPAPRFAAPPPPPPIQLPRFDTAELERIRVTQGLTAQSTRNMGVAALQAQPQIRGLQNSLGEAAQGAVDVAAAQAGIPPQLVAIGAAGAGAVALGAGLAVAAGFAVSAANEMETLKKQLTLVTGSTAAADAAFAQLQQYAQISPFETTEVVATAKQLAAFGFTTAEAVEFTRRLGDVSSATGSRIGELALSLGQVNSKGSAGIVDLNEFLRRGIPLWDLLTQATGKTRAELQALEGGIPADAILDALRILTDEGGAYFNASVTGVTALDREWATLIDTIKLAAIPLGEVLAPVVVDAITGAAKATSDWGSAFVSLKTQAESAAQNPLVAKLLGIGGRVVDGVKFIGTGGLLGQAVSRLANKGPKPTPTEIPTTAADDAKLRAREDNRKALAAKIAADEEKAAKKAEDKDRKEAAAADRRRAEFVKTQAELTKLSQLTAEVQAVGGGGIVSISPQTVASVQLIGNTITQTYRTVQQGGGILGVNPALTSQVQQIAGIIDTTGSQFAQRLVQAATQTSQELLKAQEQFVAAQRAAFDLLKDGAQQRLIDAALQNIRQKIPQTDIDPAKVEEALGISLQDDLQTAIDNVDASKLFQISDQVSKNAEASVNLKAATEANTKALTDLITAYATGAIVNVTVPAGSAVGGDAQTEVRYN